MKTVLLAWELGGGFGHIAGLRRYAARFARHGVRMVAVLRNPDAARGLADLGVEILQAPPWPEKSLSAKQRAALSSATMGDSLASAGFADAAALDGLLTRWRGIFQRVRPDLVVADYAPAASLLARGRVPLMIVGNGYTVPPSEMIHFPLLQRTVAPAWDEMRLLTIVNKATVAHGIAPLERLPQLFSADDYLVETFPLLDPHDLQRTSPADGPAFDSAPVAKRGNADKILVYLAPGYPLRRDTLHGLLPFAQQMQIYAPNLSAFWRMRLKFSGADIHNTPLDLADALASARLVIHFGGGGLASHAMAAGVPQLVLASQIEQELNGQALARAGIGKYVRAYDTDVPISAELISDLLNDGAMAQQAEQSGEEHRRLLKSYDPLGAFETRARKLLRL
ncbi:MAG: glycosyl transferase [Rhizobiales bacterium]|nr:glycosyl transferase [Hyphomicrobiales bacterium]